MKLPNGYGSVYKLSGNRRKPYIAKKTIGFDDFGKQIFKPIGYYETKEEGLQALALYNNAPYNIDLKNITFSKLYEKWINRRGKNRRGQIYNNNVLSNFKSIRREKS